jgi:nucleotide-binding universal stress UspA family protein
MVNEYKTILFTSNLSTTSRIAFEQATMVAAKFGAKIVLLHVMEGPSGSYEGYIMSLFGQEKWQEVLRNNRDLAKHALVGKVSPRQMVQTALNQFCKENKTESDNYAIPNNEIVVAEGDVVETILRQSAEHKCDLIIMGAGEGLLSGVSVGKNIKSVMKRAKVPVLVVPGNIG